MTEAEWLGCTDPEQILWFLAGKASDRKFRLFAVACGRSIWNLMPDDLCRKVVDLSEQYADRQQARRELREACQMYEARKMPGWNYAALAAYRSGLGKAFRAAVETRTDAAAAVAARAVEVAPKPQPHSEQYRSVWELAHRGELRKQCDLLRDIFYSPFRPIALDPTWLSPNVKTLAQSIYDNRAWDSLPLLADALEEAGCHDAEILSHLRGPGPHVRGCWVVDLILGKSQ